MEIKQPDLASAVKEAKKLLITKGVTVDRISGNWCLQKEANAKMKELNNVLITVEKPGEFWHNKVNKGVLLDTLDILLGLNPGWVHKAWGFYDQWRGPDGKYLYTYGERIFTGKVRQWDECVRLLRGKPSTRQANIVIRRPEDLLNRYAPCTLSIQFYVDDKGLLNETYMMRSNDMAIGGLPRNLFIGCVLLQQMGFATGLPIGKLDHFVVNLHHYMNKPNDLEQIDGLKAEPQPEKASYLDDSQKDSVKRVIEGLFGDKGIKAKDEYGEIAPYWRMWLNIVACVEAP
jgi:thymidylate synthase